MDRISGLDRMDAAEDILLAEHMVDRMQDRRSRPERIGKGHRIELQPGVLELPLQRPAAQVEFARGRALEREDRLLLVADREHRAHHAIARAGARGEFGDDVRDDVPLPRAGVLRLVDQHMVDAAVELVMHPARGDAVQHRQRLVDQIVIVEQAALLLLAPVIGRRRGRDMQQRLGAVAGDHRAAASRSGDETAQLPIRTAGRSTGLLSQNFFVTTDLRGVRSASVRKTPRYSSTCAAPVERQRLAQPRRLVLIGLAAGIQHQRDVLPSRSRQVRSVDDRRARHPRCDRRDRRRARPKSAPRPHARCRRRRSRP